MVSAYRNNEKPLAQDEPVIPTHEDGHCCKCDFEPMEQSWFRKYLNKIIGAVILAVPLIAVSCYGISKGHSEDVIALWSIVAFLAITLFGVGMIAGVIKFGEDE